MVTYNAAIAACERAVASEEGSLSIYLSNYTDVLIYSIHLYTHDVYFSISMHVIDVVREKNSNSVVSPLEVVGEERDSQ